MIQNIKRFLIDLIYDPNPFFTKEEHWEMQEDYSLLGILRLVIRTKYLRLRSYCSDKKFRKLRETEELIRSDAEKYMQEFIYKNPQIYKNTHLLEESIVPYNDVSKYCHKKITLNELRKT